MRNGSIDNNRKTSDRNSINSQACSEFYENSERQPDVRRNDSEYAMVPLQELQFNHSPPNKRALMNIPNPVFTGYEKTRDRLTYRPNRNSGPPIGPFIQRPVTASINSNPFNGHYELPPLAANPRFIRFLKEWLQVSVSRATIVHLFRRPG